LRLGSGCKLQLHPVDAIDAVYEEDENEDERNLNRHQLQVLLLDAEITVPLTHIEASL